MGLKSTGELMDMVPLGKFGFRLNISNDDEFVRSWLIERNFPVVTMQKGHFVTKETLRGIFDAKILDIKASINRFTREIRDLERICEEMTK